MDIALVTIVHYDDKDRVLYSDNPVLLGEWIESPSMEIPEELIQHLKELNPTDYYFADDDLDTVRGIFEQMGIHVREAKGLYRDLREAKILTVGEFLPDVRTIQGQAYTVVKEYEEEAIG